MVSSWSFLGLCLYLLGCFVLLRLVVCEYHPGLDSTCALLCVKTVGDFALLFYRGAGCVPGGRAFSTWELLGVAWGGVFGRVLELGDLFFRRWLMCLRLVDRVDTSKRGGSGVPSPSRGWRRCVMWRLGLLSCRNVELR